jgi:hypothetical protein
VEVPTENSYGDPPRGANLYATSMVALNVISFETSF